MEVESVVTGVLEEVRSKVDNAVSVGNVIAVLEVADAGTRQGRRPDPLQHPLRRRRAAAPTDAARTGPIALAEGCLARNRAATAATPTTAATRRRRPAFR